VHRPTVGVVVLAMMIRRQQGYVDVIVTTRGVALQVEI
jgi:hypothetical protein